jgi:hypothetical protein
VVGARILLVIGLRRDAEAGTIVRCSDWSKNNAGDGSKT